MAGIDSWRLFASEETWQLKRTKNSRESKMESDQRKEAARKGHHACKGCGAMYSTVLKDGKDCDGLPGITYKVCTGCGRATAKVKRQPRRFKL